MSRLVELVIRRIRIQGVRRDKNKGGKKSYLVRGDSRHKRGCFGLCFSDLALRRLAEVSTQSFVRRLRSRKDWGYSECCSFQWSYSARGSS